MSDSPTPTEPPPTPYTHGEAHTAPTVDTPSTVTKPNEPPFTAPTSSEEPTMSHEPTAPHAPAAVEEPYAPLASDTWGQEPLEELPPRPRRRLLGASAAGGNPLALALLGVLLLVCGFIGGVLVEKGQTSSAPASSGTAGLISRLAALRGGGTAGSGATGSGATGSGSGGGGGFPGGGFAGRFAGAGGGATIGEVSYISGNTLYVTDTEGNTIKVTTSPAASVTKTVKTDVHGIHPGETVVVRGTKSGDGAVSAESISVSAAGATGGGLSSLFGGGGRGGSSAAGAGSGAGGGGGLFGG